MHRERVVALLLAIGALAFAGSSYASMRNYLVGDRLTARRVQTTGGARQQMTFENPSVVILWSTWSARSLEAFREIMKAAPASGSRWQIIPINVDAPSLNAADTARVHAAARDAGWHERVWHDDGYQLMDEWGVLSVPTVVFTGLGGFIDEIEHGWSPVIRDRLFTRYFGTATDSVGVDTIVETPTQCRAKAVGAQREWRTGDKRTAITLMRTVIDSCSDQPSALSRCADWLLVAGGGRRELIQMEQELWAAAQNEWTRCALAGLALDRRDCSAAVVLSQEAIILDSDFFPAWMLLAQSSRLCGDTVNAKEAYGRARGLNRHNSRVLALGAAMAESRGDTKAAARLMRASVEARLRPRLH